MIAIQLNDHGTIHRLNTLLSQVKTPRQVMAPVGREAVNQLKKHFRTKDRREPNKLQGKRSHFWLQVAGSVQQPRIQEIQGTILISINHPAFAQKVFGGTIRAKRVRNLAIPASPEAYGRGPRVLERETGLKLIFLVQRGTKLLASVDPERSERLTVQYILKAKVHQQPDPTALPDQTKYDRALVARAEKVVKRLTDQANKGTQS